MFKFLIGVAVGLAIRQPAVTLAYNTPIPAALRRKLANGLHNVGDNITKIAYELDAKEII